MSESSDWLPQTLWNLWRALADQRLTSAVRCIADAATKIAPGCDGASVTLIVEGDTATEASSHRVVVEVDLVQPRRGARSCMAAVAERWPVRFNFVFQTDRVKHSAPVPDQLGIADVLLSIPVLLNDEVVGSLNLYSHSAHAFDESSRSVGTLLAAQIASALVTSDVLRASRDLVAVVQERASESEVVAQAQGVLMELYDCSSQQAAAWVDQVSRANAEPPVVVAGRILETLARDQAGSDPTS